MAWILLRLSNYQQVAPLVRTGGSRHTGLAALPHRNIQELIGRIPQIETLKIKNEKFREQEYKDCISDYCPENWVKVLKTTYKRTKSRGSITSVDRKYQTLLEHALYSEFAFALGIPAGQMPRFIEDHIHDMES